MSRLLSILIIAFWLVMTTLMVMRIYIKGERKEIEVAKVLNTFFESDTPGGEYELIRDGRKVGLISINTRQQRTKDRISRALVVSNVEDKEMPWSINIVFSDDYQSVNELRLRLLKLRLEVVISSNPENEGSKITAILDGNVIFQMDSRNSADALKSLSSFDPNIGLMVGVLAEGLSAGTGSEDTASIKAYEEVIEVVSRQQEVYTVVASFGPTQEITVYFNLLGELLGVEAFDGYELQQQTSFE